MWPTLISVEITWNSSSLFKQSRNWKTLKKIANLHDKCFPGRLHKSVCDNRNVATIATHDFSKVTINQFLRKRLKHSKLATKDLYTGCSPIEILWAGSWTTWVHSTGPCWPLHNTPLLYITCPGIWYHVHFKIIAGHRMLGRQISGEFEEWSRGAEKREKKKPGTFLIQALSTWI